MNTQSTTSSGTRWKFVKNLLRRQQRVSIIIDGPNILRKVGNKQVRLEDIEEAVSELGSINEKFTILNPNASQKLVQAISNSGYNPIIVSTGDLHLKLGLTVLEVAERNRNDILVIGSRDARCTPILVKLKEKGFKTAIIGFEPGFSVSLKNNADFVLELFGN